MEGRRLTNAHLIHESQKLPDTAIGGCESSVQPQAKTTTASKQEKEPISAAPTWKVRKEAQWEIAPLGKRGAKPVDLPSPKARNQPLIWAENTYDAQDALPYFTVGQTILTSKTSQAPARCVLLNKHAQNVQTDWRSGKIAFSLHLRYKLELTRLKDSETTTFKATADPEGRIKPSDPIQFKKLRLCCESGIPVKLLATGDFPSLPTVEKQIQTTQGKQIDIMSDLWRNGVVVLGFFWVKKVKESKHESKSFDMKNGKCSGEAYWDFEFECCNKQPPEWWCPLGDPLEQEFSENEDRDPDEPHAKRPRNTLDDLLGISMDLDQNAVGQPIMDSSLIDPELRTAIIVPPHMDIDQRELKTESESDPLKHLPEALGLVLNPKSWHDIDKIRPPQMRASLMLGWHCRQCGRLNPQIKRIAAQECPLCQTQTTLEFPSWHRKAHTEAAGPIGTLYRLDDGGHSHHTGLHALADRDDYSGMTRVEYWFADPPLPILAEIGRVKPAPRTRRAPAVGSARSAPPAPHPSQASTGPSLAAVRDPGGSRAVLSKDKRVLFTHITCPQHPNLLDRADRAFSEFGYAAPMERQVNTQEYRTGPSKLSCHYTYLAGVGSSIMHTSTPAVPWDTVPDCAYNAHDMLVEMQEHVIDTPDTVDVFNQSVFVLGSGGNGVNAFKMVHRAEDGPVGYMVLGASCLVQVMVGDGGKKRTTKAGAQRRAEVLMAHGDALLTAPLKPDDPPIEIRVKRNGLAIVLVSRYCEEKPPEQPQNTVSEMEGVELHSSSTPQLNKKGKKRKNRT